MKLISIKKLIRLSQIITCSFLLILISGLHFFEIVTKQVQKHHIFEKYKHTTNFQGLKKIIIPYNDANLSLNSGDEIIVNHNEYDIIQIKVIKRLNQIILFVYDDTIETAFIQYSNKNSKHNKKSSKFYFQKLNWDCFSNAITPPKIEGNCTIGWKHEFNLPKIVLPIPYPPPRLIS